MAAGDNNQKADVLLYDANEVPIASFDDVLDSNKKRIPTEAAVTSVRNTLSAGNSSTATLGAGAAFPGSVDNVQNFASISVQVFADEDSAIDGLIMEFSNDGTNFDTAHIHSIVGLVGRSFVLSVRAPFFRVRYINGATLQGAFRLVTLYHSTDAHAQSHRITDVLTNDENATIVRSVVVGNDTASLLRNIGAIETSPNEWRLQTQGLVESTIVTNPGDQVQAFLRDAGSLRDMNVLGGPGPGPPLPVIFFFDANPLVSDPVIRLTSVRIVMVADAIDWQDTFGKTGGALTNGCLFDGTVNGGSTNVFANLQENTDFLQLVGVTPFFDSTTGRGVIEASYDFGGALTLEPGTADQIRMTIRDDIAPGPPHAIAQFRAKLFGVEET